MRILTVCANLERGGIQRVAQTFSLGYKTRGHDVAVLAFQGGGIRQSPLEQAGVDVFVGDRGDHALNRAIKFQPEVVQIHRAGQANREETQVLNRLAAGSPAIVETSHFGRVDRSGSSKLIDVHTQLSDWCLWRWRRWLGSNRDPIGVVLNNPVDVNRFVPADAAAVDTYRREILGLPAGAFLCGRVGQADPAKWNDALITAFESLAVRSPNAWLALIGVPDQGKQRIARLPEKIRDRVLLRSLIDNDEELACFYSAMDVFVHAATIGETFGLVLTEAMLCGVPAVTAATPHRDNSQAEVVGHEHGGLVALSPRHLADSLIRIHDNHQLRAELANNCRASIVSRYDSGPTVERSLKILSIARDSQSRGEIRERIQADAELVTEIAPARIRQLLTTGDGNTSLKDWLLMKAITHPTVYRHYQRISGKYD